MSSLSLGAALRILFDADPRALRRALASAETRQKRDENAIAFAEVVQHCARDVDAVVDPLLERASTSSNARRVIVALASERELARAVSASVERALRAGGTCALAACDVAGEAAKSSVDALEGKDITSSLAAIAVAYEGRAPTRLAVAAVDAFAALSARAAADEEAEDDGREAVLRVVSSWARVASGSALYRDCCECARERLSALASTSGEVADSEASKRRALARRRLLNRAWVDWAPALVTMKPKKWESDMLATLESSFAAVCSMVDSDEDGAGEGVSHALITVGLHLGRTGIDHANREVFSSMVCEQTAAELDQLLHKYTATALLPALRCSNAVAQTVSAMLVGIILAPTHLGWTEQTETLLRGILPLIEEGSDVISIGFARLVADLIVRDPDNESLLKVLRICGGGAKSAMKSALRVLMEIMRRGGSSMPSSSLGAVVRAMLPRLSDGDLEVRKMASAIFAHTNPSQVFPALFDLLVSKDEAERSAAGEAIVATMREQASASRALESFLDALTLHTSTNLPDAHTTRTERAVKLLSRFADSVEENEWKNISKALADALFRTPSSSALTQTIAALAPWIGSPTARESIVAACARQLSSQSADKSDDEQDIFQRLAPLLLLRILPLSTWERSNPEISEIQRCLKHRMLNVRGEFDDVRRVCSELFGRMPPKVLDEELLQEFRRARANIRDKDELTRVRSCMFCCNAALAARGESGLSNSFVCELRTVSVELLASNSWDAEDRLKAQMGAFETLASLIMAEIDARAEKGPEQKKTSKELLEPEPLTISLETQAGSAAASGRALIVELENGNDVARDRTLCSLETLRGVLHLTCLTNRDIPTWVDDVGDMDETLRAALMNAIISAARRPQKSAALARECFLDIFQCAERRNDPVVREAALQALMMLFHCSQKDMDESDSVALAKLVTEILRDHAAGDAARMGATKVATALLAAEDRHIRAIEPYLKSLRQSLEVAARLAVDPEVASLAAKLTRMMTTPADSTTI